ncbi:hypothetical protein [Alkalicoccus urumqiensis]|uniref:Uncharacterized protein n=1 Tax=Alkalicoccus urumqiensis TaxID=1548213 RepID=A0A2P6MJW8_ALKUR|nr:hypothetical protein [Alkalicoccus urumqiensis]PRO66584.1 hypothetical protein C6I21_04370 [Alkalicoccus urumqiensis]
MTQYRLNQLETGKNYTAKELDSFVSTTDVVLLSSNEEQLFTDPDREYRVTGSYNGFFEHSSDNGEKYYRTKRAYIVEKT